MKHIMACITLCAIQLTSFAVDKTWIGISGSNWSTGANWSPSGTPGTLDNVDINGFTGTINMDIIPSVRSLLVHNGSVVTLTNNGSRNFSVSSTLATPKGVQVDDGCTLTFHNSAASGTVKLLVTNGTGVTGLINGNLYFTANGGSSLLETFSGAVANANFVVGSTGYIKYFANNAGNSNTSATSFTMQNGAVYEIAKNGGSFPNGSYAPNSYCLATGAVAAGPSFLGTVYGNLHWNNPSQTTSYGFNSNLTFNTVRIIRNNDFLNVKSGGGTANYTLTINDSLVIESGQTFGTTSSTVVAPYGGVVILKGHFLNNGTFTKSGAVGSRDTLELSGALNQNYSGSGVIIGQQTIKVNNPNGVTLNSPLNLPHALVLNNGLIKTDAINLLTLNQTPTFTPVISAASAIYSSLNNNPTGRPAFGVNQSYIVGPLRIVTSNLAVPYLAFPVGSNSIHRPFFIRNAIGTFTVDYKAINPITTIGSVVNAPLHHISSIEYWNVASLTGIGTGIPEATYYDPNSGGVTSMTDLRLAKYPNPWEDATSTGPITIGTPGTNGSILGVQSTINEHFTLASSTVQNPLPIKYVKLSIANNTLTPTLLWQVFGDVDVAYYTLEKSTNKVNFTTLHTQTAQHNLSSVTYNYTNQVATGYYRIKVAMASGEVGYSNTVLCNIKDSPYVLYPNPVNTQLTILTNNTAIAQLYNSTGALVLQQKLIVGKNSINVQALTTGAYNVIIIDGVTTKKTTSIVNVLH